MMIINDLSPDGVIPLWEKTQIELALNDRRLPDWVRVSYEAFVKTIQQKDFPCFFATIAEQKKMIRYAIAPSLTTPESLEHILEAVYTYLEEERQLIANSREEDSSLLTLTIFFPLEDVKKSVEDYVERAYAFLNGLHQRDRFPWPEDIPTDSTDVKWRYCLGGRSLFANICTPANHKRRSRNVGPGLTIVINPEDVFTTLWERWGERPRREIYKRMEAYDLIPPHPLLLSESPEEERHFKTAAILALPEGNDRRSVFPFHYNRTKKQQGRCPFHSLFSAFKKAR